MAIAFFAICLVLASTSAAIPHGNRKLQEAAISILTHTEVKGGEIINKLLIERSFNKGGTTQTTDSAVLVEARAFLQELLSTLTTFKDLVRTSKQATAGTAQQQQQDEEQQQDLASRRRNHNHRHPYPSHYPSFPALDLPFPLPPGINLEDLEGLSYNEILDILGEYIKGFADSLLPSSGRPVLGVSRDVILAQINDLVDRVVGELQETEDV